eukprot:3299432-Prymnesium_polylepis.1
MPQPQLPLWCLVAARSSIFGVLAAAPVASLVFGRRCGRAIGTSLVSSGTIEAVEQVGSYFKGYEVHLLLQLFVRERDNTRNAVRAWAVRNPHVNIH